MSLFSQLARRGESIPLYEDGAIVRDFVLIDDVADALAAVIDRGPSGRSGPYDIGTGVGTTIAQLAEAVAEFHGAPAPQVNGRFRDGDVRAASTDIAPSLAALDWAPRWDLTAGIAALQRWIDEVDPR